MNNHSVTVRAPASATNLGPGFDALGLALDLWEEVTLAFSEKLQITVGGRDPQLIPTHPKNLTFRAATRLSTLAGKPLEGLSLRIHNAIPLWGGLGGSAAAIAAGLVGANRLLNDPYSLQELVAIAAEIEGHPDNVAAALLGGLVVCSSGETLTTQPFPAPRLWVALAIPHTRVSTRRAREALPATLPHATAVRSVGRACLLTASLLSGHHELLSQAMQDELHEPYRTPLVPGYLPAREAALRAGALGVAISGSGPAILAFCSSEDEAVRVARQMSLTLSEARIDHETVVTHPSALGAGVTP